MKQILYFAYGSNLDPARMRRRCATATPVGPAMLGGWRLAFGGHSRAWGGPVATLVKAPDEGVDGLLHALPPQARAPSASTRWSEATVGGATSGAACSRAAVSARAGSSAASHT